MAWIESHQELLGHPKTRHLARLLDMPRIHAIGHLHALWWWCMDYADDGQLGRFENDVIADACEWTGDPDTFVNALISAGFLDQIGHGYAVHDWDAYAGKLIRRRRSNAERMREQRSAHNDATNDATAGDETPRAAHVQRTCETRADMCEATVPNRTQPDSTEPDQTRPTAARTRAREPVPKPRAVARADPVWDAVAEVCGSPATRSERSDFGETVSQLRQAGATPEEIAGFGPWWWRTYPDANLTHRCLRGHWGKYLTAPARPVQPSDIQNPMARAILSNPNGLADIAAELRAKHGPDDDIRPLDIPAGGADANSQRLDAGGRPPPSGVLPAVGRVVR